MDQEELLQRRLDQNYRDYVAGLQGKTADELIALAPEITAAQQLRDGLVPACSEESLGFLIGLEDSLAFVRGYWITELTRESYSEEMGRMLWDIQRQGEIPAPASDPAPAQTEGKPVMRLSGKERRLVLIAGLASNILHDTGRHAQAHEVFQRVMDCGGYHEALLILRAYVDLEIIPAVPGKNKPEKKEDHTHDGR